MSWMGQVTEKGWIKPGAMWLSSGEVWQLRCGEARRRVSTCGLAGCSGFGAVVLGLVFDMGWSRVRHNL